MRLLLTGGGTAGHVYPLLAVFEELKRKLKDERLEVLYIGSKGGIEEKILQEKIPAFFIYSGKWRRYWLKSFSAFLLNLLDLFKIILGFFQAFFILTRARPDVILAKGGYVSLPIILAAYFCRIPLIVHESDVILGLSNKISALFAKKICVSFPLDFYPGLPREKMVETGNPVRKAFYRKFLRKKRGKYPTILVTGGSQGSQKINQLIYQILPVLLKKTRLFHLTGPLGYEEAKKIKEGLNKKLKERYFIFDFAEMPKVMREADLLISRAGANTLAEIAALGKPSILIPLKTAASSHQRRNAEIFKKRKAAILLSEEVSPSSLLSEIENLIKNKSQLKEMGKQAKKLSYPQAASKIAEEILKLRT